MSDASFRPSSLLTAPLALGLSLALTLGLSALGLFAIQMVQQPGARILALSAIEIVLYVGAAFYVGRIFVGAGVSRALGPGRAGPLQLLLGASLGVVLHLPAGYLDSLVERRFPTSPERMAEQLAQLTPQSAWHAASLVLAVALLAPFAEEVFFRGALFTALRRSGPLLTASWTTSIAFVLAHQEPRMWAPLLLVALVLSQLRSLSGSIWPGFALHAAFNATTLGSVFTTRPSALQAPQVSWALGLGGALLTLAGVWSFGRVSQRRVLAEGSQ